MKPPQDPPLQEWPVSWEANRKAQLGAMLSTTPAQRLEWLEEALRLAESRGALKRLRERELAEIQALFGSEEEAGR